MLVEGGKGVGGVVLRGEDARGKAAQWYFLNAPTSGRLRALTSVSGAGSNRPLASRGGRQSIRTFAMLGGGSDPPSKKFTPPLGGGVWPPYRHLLHPSKIAENRPKVAQRSLAQGVRTP